MSSLDFEYPWLAVLFVLPVGLLFYFYFARIYRRQPALHYPAVSLHENALSVLSRLTWLRPHLLLWLHLVGLALLVLTAMNPIRSLELSSTKQYGVDIVLAVDASGSMHARDFAPANRFEAARQVLHGFVERRRNDRLGVVVFAGEALVQAPQTTENQSILEILRSLRVDRQSPRTAIGEALAVSASRLLDSTADNRLIVLITDGSDNAHDKIRPLAAVAAIKELGIKIYTIGIGDPRRGDVDFNLLAQIAAETGAKTYVARNTAELQFNMDEIDRLEKSFVSQKSYRKVNEMALPFLFAALAVLSLALVFDKLLWRVAL